MKMRVIAGVLAVMVLAYPAMAQQRDVPQGRGEVMLSFAPIVKRTAPAVVNIYTKTVITQREPGFMADPFFRRFFGEKGTFGRPRERVANSLGSGVIVDGRGFIVMTWPSCRSTVHIESIAPCATPRPMPVCSRMKAERMRPMNGRTGAAIKSCAPTK